MPGFKRTATIDVPPARVFAVLTDLAQAPLWMPAIERTEWVRGDRVAAGAAWRETRRAGKRTLAADVTVVRCQKDRVLDLRVEAKPFRMDLGFDLMPAGAGTLVEYQCHGRGKGLMALASRALMRRVEAQDDDLLLRLKARAESQEAGH